MTAITRPSTGPGGDQHSPDPSATAPAIIEGARAPVTAPFSEPAIFSDALAHDLKETVRTIRHLARFVADDMAPSLDPASAERLAHIDQHCQRCAAMMDAVLDVARLTSVPLHTETVSVAEIVAQALHGIMPLINQHQAAVGCESDTDGTRVRVDPNLAARALRHLITNAIIHNGSPNPWVRVALREPDAGSATAHPSLVTITVTDNGPGIAAKDARNLFRMFHRPTRRGALNFVPGAAPGTQPQADPAPVHPQGVGAGLTIARTIAERHGGRVWMEQREAPQTGSIFCITLPSE